MPAELLRGSLEFNVHGQPESGQSIPVWGSFCEEAGQMKLFGYTEISVIR